MIRQIQRACNIDYDRASYPLLATPKLDGVFAYITQGAVRFREGDAVPNSCIQETMRNFVSFCVATDFKPEGELTIKGEGFNFVSGVARSHKSDCTGLTYTLFDCFSDLPAKFRARQVITFAGKCADNGFDFVRFVIPEVVNNASEAKAKFAQHVQLGFEGTVFRSPTSLYKPGKSTLAEASFLRDKFQTTYTGRIVCFDPSYDLYGSMKPMSHAAQVYVEELKTTVKVSMTRNLTDDDRSDFFMTPDLFIGRKLEFTVNKSEGMEVRSPIFYRWIL